MINVSTEESTEDKYLKTNYATEFEEPWLGKVFNSLVSNFLWTQLVNFHNFFVHDP